MRRSLALGAALLACALPAQAQAVVGGANVPEGGAPYAVELLSPAAGDGFAWERAFCAGTVVGPRTVLRPLTA